MSASSPYLLVEDIARLLGCSVRTVHERTRLAEIPHRRPPGARRCLFLADEIKAWLDGAPLEFVELPQGGRVVRPRQDGRRRVARNRKENGGG
jgi:excisionase family DNA binding protein